VEEARKLTDRRADRAIEEKAQFERESEIIRNQYKEFKQEFKKCERILPTQGFL
jgi:hypothetical protein